jgi:predicted AAA+ superfamily ATPase
VATELLQMPEKQLYGWSERNSEIEFILKKETGIIPVEVKYGHRTKAKSLDPFMIKYNPPQSRVLSERMPSHRDKKKYVPLYLAGKLNTRL